MTWLGYACAAAFVLVIAAGVTVGVLTDELGPEDPPREDMPPTLKFGHDRAPGHEREWGK